MITTDEMRILLSINGAASYTTTINEVTNVTKNYDRTVGNLISTLGKLVSAGLMVKFGKQCLEAASNLQEVANVVDVTFGQSAQLVNEWARSNAASFGLSETAAKRYIGTFGTMAKQFNMTSKDAAYMGIELTKLSGDVASFYNISDQAAASKLKAVFTGETESLKELGVVMTQTQLDAYAMANGWNKTTKDMTEQEKVVLRYQYTMEKLSHAQGDFARTSDGYANSLRRLKLNFENLKVEIGNELLPVAAQGIGAIGSLLQAVSPFLVSIAQTVRYYAQAWAEASESTKAFVKIAGTGIALMYIIPKVVLVAQGAVRLLTMQIVGLNGALAATAGIIGFIFALLAFIDLSKSVSEMQNATGGVENLGDSANISAENVDTLADSLDGLADSAQGLDTFLTSFDEVNKVGGGGSLMSNLVTSQDLANILGAATGIEDLQNELNSLSVPEIGAGTIFSKEWWDDKKEMILGYLDTIGTHEWAENWWRGLESIDSWIEEHMPQWHAKFTHLGEAIFDALHPDAEKDTRETFTFTDWQGRERTGLKYNEDGTLTDAYLNHGSISANNTVTNTTINNTSQSSSPIDVTLLLDGRKIASVVTDLQNEKARSSGISPVTN